MDSVAVLLKHGVLSQERADELRALNGEAAGKPLHEVAVQRGYVAEEDGLTALGVEIGA